MSTDRHQRLPGTSSMGDAGRTRPVVQPSKPAHLTAAPVLRRPVTTRTDGVRCTQYI